MAIDKGVGGVPTKLSLLSYVKSSVSHSDTVPQFLREVAFDNALCLLSDCQDFATTSSYI